MYNKIRCASTPCERKAMFKCLSAHQTPSCVKSYIYSRAVCHNSTHFTTKSTFNDIIMSMDVLWQRHNGSDINLQWVPLKLNVTIHLSGPPTMLCLPLTLGAWTFDQGYYCYWGFWLIGGIGVFSSWPLQLYVAELKLVKLYLPQSLLIKIDQYVMV